MHRMMWVAVTAALLAIGCSHPVDSLSDKEIEYYKMQCECPEFALFGGTTPAVCRQNVDALVMDPDYGATLDCVKGAYDRHSDSLGPVLDCYQSAYGRGTSCLEGAGCDEVAVQDCNDDLSAVSLACPHTPAAVEEEIDACAP